MEHQDHLPEQSFKGKAIRHFPKVLMSFILETVSHPIKSGLIYFTGALIGALLIGWVVFPMVLYSKDEQPFNFSHAIHTNPDIMSGETEAERCANCHSFRDDGTFTGVPKLAKCMECHENPESPMGKSLEEKKFLEEYVAKQKEIPWHIYYQQPDNVYFSHIPHVKNAELDCKTCHGNHGSTDTLPVYKQNRISGYSINIWGKNISGYKKNTWDRMKMDDCAECHTKKGNEKNNECFVCHK
jgi:menaquinone reductase, multiheme cytochrome c subunit